MDEEDSMLSNDGANESMWNSPEKSTQRHNNRPVAPAATKSSAKASVMDQDRRDDSLREELDNVRRVNMAIEGVLQSLERAKANMTTVNQTVGAASSLLNTWTRILSQTEHNQRLILDPTWQGTSQDLADMEAAAVAKQQAALQKEVQEQERRKVAAQKAEEEAEEQRRADTLRQPKQPPRGRGRGRVTARPGNASSLSLGSASSANTSILGAGRGTATTNTTNNTSKRGSSGSAIGRVRGRAGRGQSGS